MTDKTNPLFEQCLANVDPETRAEVRGNMELLDKACDWLENTLPDIEYITSASALRQNKKQFINTFRKAMFNCGEIAINKPEYDAEYLQSKIDAFSEARRKDGKTADEMLDDCRGGALELTWQDIREIVEIADDIAVHEYANRPTGQEDYYTEILRRFRED